MSIYEYDYEKHIRMEREEHWQDGHEKGLEEGMEKGLQKGHRNGAISFINFCKNNRMPKEMVLNGLLKEYHFSKTDALTLMDEYFK